MILRRLLTVLAAITVLALPAPGQEATGTTTPDPRAATGGAQTLEDILARQQGLAINDSFRRDAIGNPEEAAPTTDQLGTLGGVSDPELWRAYRYGEANLTFSTRMPSSHMVVQDSGMRWLAFREGPLLRYGGYLLLGMIGVLVLFYLVRGKIRIEGEHTGKTITRFNAIERFGHWLMAGSFVVLALTGLFMIFGRVALIPAFGKDAYASIAAAGKWAHNNIAWAFMAGLVLATVVWIAHNIPNRHDLKWLAVGGGLFSKGVHPPARKFNAGQKIIFWAVVVLGISISVSGLSLLFPFELPLFAKTFAILNGTGLPQALGYGELPTALSPYQEMQLAQIWHGIVAFVFMAIIIAHIYLGSVGMEGAFDAVGTGEVDVQWAKEHHGLWYEEVTGEAPAHPAPEPAE
ncbi:formate dehydrogenase subunit gamma [Defluviimonas sp. SAOS-178_SWC]|uniref:formate dehydrogenase subunit gamma n=1 Tax=Defluviimonas sp. SAOS-178_SWC TaxID=3121287 RepID=UPI0032222220